jgi:uncharacterized membrane protein YkoI
MRANYCLFFVICLILSAQSAHANAGTFKSSIQTTYTRSSESREEVNTPRLKKLAKVTADQARQIARARFKGSIKQVDLENEDGNVIWSVEIGTHELSIDAGNGKILAIE